MFRNILRRRAVALGVLILLATSGRSAHASITPDAAKVVDRFLAAAGGADVVRSLKTQHVIAKIETFGLTGTVEQWVRTPDQRAQKVELGPIRLREGDDGKTAWRTDPTGKLVLLDGKDLENTRADSWYENELWLLPDQGGGAVALVKDSTASANQVVLELTPPAGRARRLVFDTKTGLPVRSITKRDQQTVTTTLSDYRDVRLSGGARKMAYAQKTAIEGLPQNDVTTQVQTMELNVDTPDSLFRAPTAKAPEVVRYLKTPGTARLPFEYASRHLWLRASVNGQPPADFIFDTGASITVIDSAYAAKIGLERQGNLQSQGASAAGSASLGVLKTLKVEGEDGDGVEMKDQRIGILSVNPFLAPFFWRDCAGIIGYDFISRFVNEIDYDGKTLTLRDPATFQYSGGGTAIPMTLSGTIPVVPMKIDGKYEGQFRLDVGSSSTVDLHTPFVKQNDLKAQAGKSVEATGGGFGGTFTSTVVRMKKLEVGPYSWSEPIISLSNATAGALASEDYAGNVGNHLLERFKVTLDYEKKIVYLEPGKRYASRDQFSRSGAQLARFGDTVKVAQVLEHSPADRAGLREGDVVTSIEGRAVTAWTQEELRALEEKPETKELRVELLRDGKKKKLTVKLEDLL